MAQFIYLIAAFLAMMTLLMTQQRGVDRTRQTEIVNEVSTQLTNAAAEVAETVGRSYFDRFNRDQQLNKYIDGVESNGRAFCGRVEAGRESYLTDPADITARTHTCATLGGCDIIEGFHDIVAGDIESGGADTTVTRGGFRINLDVRVGYVDPSDYSSAGADTDGDGIGDGLSYETFAKQVTVTAHTPDAFIGDDPSDFDKQLKLSLVRVFTYTCPTDPLVLPWPGGGQTCQSIGAAPPGCAVDNGA